MSSFMYIYCYSVWSSHKIPRIKGFVVTTVLQVVMGLLFYFNTSPVAETVFLAMIRFLNGIFDTI